MSKKTETTKPEAKAEGQRGTVTITAKTREELAEKFAELKASNQDAVIMAGAVGRNGEGNYVQQIDIV